MVNKIPAPPRPAGTVRQQLDALYRYLNLLAAIVNLEATYDK